MEPLSQLTYKHLSMWTDYFSESKYIGHFQRGKFYRKTFEWPDMDLHCVVKIWDIPEADNCFPRKRLLQLADEIILLHHERMLAHPCMVKIYGFCADGEHVGAMYELQASDSVYNLIPKDSFTWLQRVKVALGIASLLKFLHTRSSQYPPFRVLNLDAAHILLDENCWPHLCDFGMITGGIFPHRKVSKIDCVHGCYGHIDPCAGENGDCSDKLDVFAYGILLLGLITKRNYTKEDRQDHLPSVHEWAQREHEVSQSEIDMKALKCSLVHESLTNEADFESDDGVEITAMAMACLNVCATERPMMKQVLRSLLTLPVVKKHATFLEVSKLPHHPEKNGH